MKVTKKIKEQLLNEANYECEYCGTKVNEHTAMIDHKIPLSKGGSSDAENLAISCPKCNIIKADRIFGTVSAPIVESAAKLWIQAYLKKPMITAALSIIAIIITVISIYHEGNFRKQKIEAELSQKLDFKVQMEQLNETENSLNSLLQFVSSQKKKMIQHEQSISHLERERENLEPLVNADKKIVEALFKAQEERAIANVNKERWIGFGLGIIASIIASFALVIGRFFVFQRREAKGQE